MVDLEEIIEEKPLDVEETVNIVDDPVETAEEFKASHRLTKQRKKPAMTEEHKAKLREGLAKAREVKRLKNKEKDELKALEREIKKQEQEQKKKQLEQRKKQLQDRKAQLEKEYQVELKDDTPSSEDEIETPKNSPKKKKKKKKQIIIEDDTSSDEEEIIVRKRNKSERDFAKAEYKRKINDMYKRQAYANIFGDF